MSDPYTPHGASSLIYTSVLLKTLSEELADVLIMTNGLHALYSDMITKLEREIFLR